MKRISHEIRIFKDFMESLVDLFFLGHDCKSIHLFKQMPLVHESYPIESLVLRVD